MSTIVRSLHREAIARLAQLIDEVASTEDGPAMRAAVGPAITLKSPFMAIGFEVDCGVGDAVLPTDFDD